MALSDAERERVAELLQQHPDWRTGQIRQAAGLDPKQVLAVKTIRQRLGVPEPDNGQAKAPRRRGRPPKVAADTLDTSSEPGADAGDIPTPSPAGRSKRGGFKSLFAPALPTLIQAAAFGVMGLSGRVTNNPMTPVEASGVVTPLARIGDRLLAKYVRVGTGKASPDAEDVRDAAFTIIVYLLRVLADGVAQRAARQHAASATATATGGGGMPSWTPPSPAPMVHVSMPGSAAGAPDDLFAGSEPATVGGAASDGAEPSPPSRPAPTHAGRALAAEGIAGPHSGGVPDAFWNAISPTDLGNAEA